VLGGHNANIVSLDQYSDDPRGGAFFQRTVFSLDNLKAALPDIARDLDKQVKRPYGLTYTLRDLSAPKRMAVLASKSDPCLLDLLWRHRRGELSVSIPMVISNHPDMADEVRGFGVPFFHVPSMGPDKSAAEAEHLRLLKGNVDFVVLARYMQILSSGFIEGVSMPIINIHHSFLPAFIDAGPYAKAKERGVKLIGATAHYVTEDLDEGPIVEQDVVRVTHADTAVERIRLLGPIHQKNPLHLVVRSEGPVDRVIYDVTTRGGIVVRIVTELNELANIVRDGGGTDVQDTITLTVPRLIRGFALRQARVAQLHRATVLAGLSPLPDAG
jgi:formyltetrahydrofolate deformylase